MKKKQRNINFGAAGLFILFSLLFFVLAFRFISIQVTGEAAGQPLAAKAESLYNREKILEARRGTIYDRNGEAIAEDIHSYKLVAILSEKATANPKEPKHVTDPANTAKKLAEVINLDESEIYKQLTKGGDPYQVEFGKAGRDLTLQQKSEIEEMKLPGITFIQDIKRFYPNGIFASHLIGYVEQQANDEGETETVGMLGLENTLNAELSGKNGSFQYEADFWGYLLPNGKEIIKPAEDGYDVYLTIDKKIQILLEDALTKVNKEYDPEKMVAIVADPKTGDILAMSQRPTFHPKTRDGIENTWRNLAVEDSFEPGSTMKIFTLAAAVEEGVFNANAQYQSGRYKVTEKSPTVPDHNGGRGWGTITYLEGVQRSSNVAFAKLVKEQLGYDTFREYLTKFGFEAPTGIDLPNETGGKIAYDWPIEKVSTGFGQGTAITPIQQIQAATAIAHDGSMKKPHVISRIVDPDKNKVVKKTKPVTTGQPISADAAKEVRDILETVISSEKGTGYNRFNIDGYEVAGKTGTAQIPKNGGGYLSGHQNYIFSFIGMAPADDPELLIYVAVQQPKIDESTIGSMPVAEIFKPVMKSSLQYLNIEPTSQPKISSSEAPDVSGLSVEEAERIIADKGLTPVITGSGEKVEDQFPADMTNMLAGERVLIKTEGQATVPDMSGWSRRDVLKFTKIANLKLHTVGSGYAVKQSLTPGSILADGDYLIVEFVSPEELYNKQHAPEEEVETEEEDNPVTD